MKIYQIVSAADGSRSEPVSAPSFSELSKHLQEAIIANPALAGHFVLVLLEDADSKPYVSRAPMMRVQTVIDTFKDTETK